LRVSPPLVGRLLAVSRVMAHRRIAAGDFGAVHRHHRVREVDLVAVAACVGSHGFTFHQLRAAGLPVPFQPEEETVY
jgi:hypothetical protein